MKYTVAITTGIDHKGFELFCPNRELKWDNCEFILNPENGSTVDFWIAFGRPGEPKRLTVAPENTLFITTEPPSKRIFSPAFYAQFENIVSCNAADPHPRVTVSQLGLPWYVGRSTSKKEFRLGYEQLSELPYPNKSNSISVICSNKAKTKGQEARLIFLEKAKREFGDKLIHYGRGFTSIDDKMDAILPHRYSLALENCSTPHYWSEKLADAFLGWAHPIYYGCDNISEYFAPSALTSIDIEDPDAAFRKMEAKLALEVNESVLIEELSACRDKILNQYNPFARFAYWTNHFYNDSAVARSIKIRPHKRKKFKHPLLQALNLLPNPGSRLGRR